MPALPPVNAAWRWLQRIGYLVALIPIAQAAGGFLAGGWRAWQVPLVAFGLAPLVDYLLGDDPSPPPAGDEPRSSPWHDLMLHAFVLGYWALLLFGLGQAQEGGWTAIERLGNTLSMGVVGGLGIVVAHELGHRKTLFPRLMAQALLQPLCYGHFTLEHNRGHHAWVATPDDPATARYGESFYRFYLRCVPATWLAAKRLESERMARLGLPAWHYRNAMWRHALIPLGMALVIVWLFGPLALLFWAGQALIGFSLLEVVNYLEHYGLQRQPIGDGRFEPTRPQHSWNSNHLFSNLFVYQLQRHSDHHAFPARPYQALRPWLDAPQLPSGYTAMIPLALLPPLWFRVMNPRVQAWRERQGSL
ncbi:alkane 1-monooxygenase [Chitinimonas sp.]|uniref:alkane 1-monooxygenase n=1 Tax=Chitinimonas sp. TaxID=1934313 RepID=UPI0035AE20DD